MTILGADDQNQRPLFESLRQQWREFLDVKIKENFGERGRSARKLLEAGRPIAVTPIGADYPGGDWYLRYNVGE